MPGFTDVAADMDLAALLGTESFGLLIRLCHIARPAGDLPGSWVVDHTQAELATHLGCARNTLARQLRLLTDAGVLHLERGRRLGRGMGTTNDRYFLAVVPGMTLPQSPAPTPPGARRGTDPQVDTRLGVTTLHSRALKDSAVKPGAPQPSVPSATAGSTVHGAGTVSDLTDEFSSHDDTPEHPNPPAVDAPGGSPLLALALARIGWEGPPPVTDVPAVVAAVATWLARETSIGNKAGYLNRLIRAGDLERFATERGLVTAQDTVNRMPAPEFVALKRAHPDWAARVEEAARQLAAERGVPVRMAVLCEAALTIPLPHDATAPAAESVGGGGVGVVS